jgi:hypothetical protein
MPMPKVTQFTKHEPSVATATMDERVPIGRVGGRVHKYRKSNGDDFLW